MTERLNPREIMRATCKDYGMTLDQLTSHDKRYHFVKARKECSKRMLEAGMGIADIAYYLNRKYHNIAYYFNGKAK